MTRNLADLYSEPNPQGSDEPVVFRHLRDRDSEIAAYKAGKPTDVIVIGAGPLGSMCAHRAAIQDLRIAVLDSPGLVPDGMWYAALLEGTCAGSLRSGRTLSLSRDFMRESARIAPHLISEPGSYGIAVRLGDTLRAFWDRYVHRNCHQWVLGTDVPPLHFESSFVDELLLAARQEGASHLSRASAEYVELEGERGSYVVGVRDLLNGEVFEVRCGAIVVDMSVGELPGSRLRPTATFAASHSRYVHVLFEAGRKIPSLCVRHIDSKGRTYLFAATEGGVLVTRSIAEPTISYPEVVSACYEEAARAGVALGPHVSSWSSLGTRCTDRRMEQRGGIFIPQLRGPWDLTWAVDEILRVLLPPANSSRQSLLGERSLPGAYKLHRELEAFKAEAERHGSAPKATSACCRRWGGLVRYITQIPSGFDEIVDGVLKGELELAYRARGIVHLAELVFRTLALHTSAGWRDSIDAVADEFAKVIGRNIDSTERDGVRRATEYPII